MECEDRVYQSMNSGLCKFDSFKGILLATGSCRVGRYLWKPTEDYRIEFFKFRRPIQTDYRFTLYNVDYELKHGADGVLLFLPITNPIEEPRCRTIS